MAVAKNSNADEVKYASVLFCKYFSRADVMVVEAVWRRAVVNIATDSKDVVSLAAEEASADTKVVKVVSYGMC